MVGDILDEYRNMRVLDIIDNEEVKNFDPSRTA
jgi:hypothetical protein